MNATNKARLLQNRRWRIRKKVHGTAERPRLAVRFTGKHALDLQAALRVAGEKRN